MQSIICDAQKKPNIVWLLPIGTEMLLRVEEEKDLGVTLSSKLMWDSHINEVV
jgi:hypothetical protein